MKGDCTYIMQKLDEITRKELIQTSKVQSPARVARSKNYSAKDFKDVNFKDLFENDTFTWTAKVGDYFVTISFDGPMEELKWYVKSMKGRNRIKRLTQQLVASALTKALDTEDIYVSCTCKDWKYRFARFATKDNYNAGAPETRPNRFKRTNSDLSHGRVCKHLLAVLVGKRWVPSAAKAWLNYMRKNPELTEFYLWGKQIPQNSSGDSLEKDNKDTYSKVKSASESKIEKNSTIKKEAYLDKDAYARKQAYVDKLMQQNAEVDTLTPEQHEALEELARIRHNFHSNMEDLFYTNSANYQEFTDLFEDRYTNKNSIDYLLSSVGLPDIKFSHSILEIPDDYLWDEVGYGSWEEAYEAALDIANDFNNDIENYLANIDKEHGTQYCPTGFARLRG